MKFQEKIMETSAELRARAAALAEATVEATRKHADLAATQFDGLRKSVAVLNVAGQEFSRVARLHARRFVKQNSPLLAAARKDVSDLARSTYRSLSGGAAPKVRQRASARKRARKAA